jgi:predicted nucleotide-binding protein
VGFIGGKMIEGLDSLIMEGQSLLKDPGSGYISHQQRDYERWVDKVSTKISKIFPNSGLLAEWNSLGTPMISYGGFFSSDRSTRIHFINIVEKRMSWLARLARSDIELQQKKTNKKISPNPNGKIFLVHGRNEKILQKVARLLEKLNLEPIILHEQPNHGRTIIEKFEDYSDVAYVVVLLTKDDLGKLDTSEQKEFFHRARQNVIFEMGYFIAKIGRKHVCTLYEEGVEIPSDYQGVLYIPIDEKGSWQLQLAKEMKSVGIPLDMNRLTT